MSPLKNLRIDATNLLAAVFALACLSAGSAAAGTNSWIVATGDWSTDGNWDNGEPVSGTIAYITNGGTATITLPGEIAYDLNFGTYPASGSGNLIMNSGSLTMERGIRGGRGEGMTNTINVNGGTLTTWRLQIGAERGFSYFYQDSGTVTVTSASFIGYGAGSAYYRLGGGVLNNSQASIGYANMAANTNAFFPGATGVFDQVGGVHTFDELDIGVGWDDGGIGTYNLQGGELIANPGAWIDVGCCWDAPSNHPTRPVGVINQSGGTFTLGASAVLELGFGVFTNTPIPGFWPYYDLYGWIGNAFGSGTYNFTGGTLTDNGNGAVLIVVNDAGGSGTFRGKGKVDISGRLYQGGQVIADGGLLDMTSFTSLTNHIENTALNGWFAVNSGSLRLPGIPVATGAGSYNWGESPDDANLDLVNSVRITFDNVTGAGAFSNELFATNSAALPAPIPATNKFQGVWRMGFSGTFSNQYALEFRYDPTPYHSERVQPQVFHCEDGQWVSYPATKLPGYRVRAANMNIDLSTSQWFAVQVDLPKGTVIAVYPQLR